MSLAKHEAHGLPSLEKARAILTKCRSVQEVMKIKAIAQAVASCHAAEQAGHEAQAIVLLATARVGELTKELEDTRKTSRQFAAPSGKLTKRENLAKHGLDSSGRVGRGARSLTSAIRRPRSLHLAGGEGWALADDRLRARAPPFAARKPQKRPRQARRQGGHQGRRRADQAREEARARCATPRRAAPARRGPVPA